MRLTRRGLIGAGAAGAFGASALGGVARAASDAPRRVDVVVVGGGLSGLAAARKLVRAGRTVVVLEANARAGGRVRNVAIAGSHVEAGGQWVAPGQRHVLGLLAQYGLKTFDTYSTGATRLDLGGRVRSFRGGALPLPPNELAALGRAVSILDGYARAIRLDAPWTSAHAAELDTWTVGSWVAVHVKTPAARRIVSAQMASAGGWSPSAISLLFALFVAHSAGGLKALTSTQGVLKSRVVGGTGLLVDALARDLGDRVVLRAPVRRIERTAKEVVVRSDKGSFVAERVIVAVPPGMSGQIDYEPALPPLRAQLMQRAPMGWTIKVFAAYETPFWRSRDLNGQAQSDGFPVIATFDESPAGGAPGVILGLIAGGNAPRWAALPAAERRAAVLRQYAAFFGSAATKPLDYVEVDWALQPYIQGGAAMFLQPGTLTEYGPALRAPVGRIHWAATETATRFWGDMDGAISAGERAAAEALRA